MFQKKTINRAVVSVIAAGAVGVHVPSALAQKLEEVVVTATKRAASMQDVAVAVSAVTEEKLDQMGVTNFEDYLIQLPGVTAGGSGPGQNTIYIRGVASTTPNLSTTGVAGLAPNVALYLDEQPLSQPGRNLDVYAADLNRVEVLAGPQGTLFGASSQAGTVRLITNKPDFSDAYGEVKVDFSSTKEGESSNKFEAMYNLPISDRVAVRAVAYRDDQGGYIDNVQGELTLAESARFRDAGTMRSNGVPVSLARAGFQSAAYINSLDPALGYTSARVPFDPNDPNSLVEFRAANNQDLVEDDFNDTLYEGVRVAARVELSSDWSLLLSAMTQDMETDGTFTADPTLGEDDPSVQRYSPDRLEDSFDNFSWTLEGRLGELEVVYTGAYTERESDQVMDYTDYMFVGQYLPYYICDSSVTYPEYNYYFNDNRPLNVSSGVCYEPNTYVVSYTETEVSTHEIRISTDQSRDWRITAGAFLSKLELAERVDFSYPSINQANFFDIVDGASRPDNFPFPGAYNSDSGPFPADTVFRNDILRTDDQFGVFGEFTYDFGDQLSVTVGARYFDVEVDMIGGANSSFGNMFWAQDVDAFGTNISDLYDGDGSLVFVGDTNPALRGPFQRGITFEELSQFFETTDGFSFDRGRFVNAPNAISDLEIDGLLNALNAPDKAEASGTIMKYTISYTPNDDVLLFATISEGFRPGLLNRPGGAPGPGGYTVPFELETDDVTNYEFGWKVDLAGGTVRFNGSAFFVEIENLQTTIFDPIIANLFFSDNAADAEVTGVEGDVTWLVQSVPGLTMGASFSILDTKITKVLTPTDDVRKGDSLAFAPEMQFNANARYEWTLGNGLDAHVMGHVAYSDESYSDIIRINRDRIDSWTMMGISAGVSSESWDAVFYVDNLTDERAELSRNYVNDRERATYARPQTMGLRLSYKF